MRVLIVVQERIPGSVLKVITNDQTTQVILIRERGSNAIDMMAGVITTLDKALLEANLIIVSHPDDDVVLWVQEQAQDKMLVRVLEEGIARPACIPFNLFSAMWLGIAEAARAKLEKDS